MGSLIQSVVQRQQRVQFIQPPTGTIITLDACVKETHSRESPPTEFEIENGQTVSDHIIVKPFSLELEGVISDTPISIEAAALTTLTSVATPTAGIILANAGRKAYALYNAVQDSNSPSQLAFKQLIELQSNKQPFDVLTSLRRYENMWIKNISVPRDAATGKILQFTIQLVELLLVSPQTVNLQVFKDADLAASLANQGKQEMIDPGIAKAAKAGRVAGNLTLGVTQ